MVALIIFGLMVVGLIIFAFIRISVSSMFWLSKKPNDKAFVFRTYFPYYIISLFGFGVWLVIKFNFESFIIYCFASTFFLALLIWNYKLKHCKKQYNTIKKNNESQNPSLP